jgi:hypothetical protein
MKHYEVNFVDRTVEIVMADSLPVLTTPETARFWSVILLTVSAEEPDKLVPHGNIYINLDNVTYIKET